MKKFSMMMSVLLTMGMAGNAWAENITVKVDGMVCAFCAAGIEQLFTDEPGVKAVKVDLDNAQVSVTTDDGVSLSDARVAEIIKKSGFEAGAITRQ
jgi:copper chaperone CopZ